MADGGLVSGLRFRGFGLRGFVTAAGVHRGLLVETFPSILSLEGGLNEAQAGPMM